MKCEIQSIYDDGDASYDVLVMADVDGDDVVITRVERMDRNGDAVCLIPLDELDDNDRDNYAALMRAAAVADHW